MPKATPPPLIKRQTPEGHNYKIVIPENVEYIIRKFCSNVPNNEWSGTLFFTFEGDFNSPEFKIICKDFLLMDLGSGAFTEFVEDGTAMDYMVQHPELLDCQMGLLHSHDTMATFFSGTDTHTLQVEGFDRNNFVSLIVNNAGVYSAAITRKVEYTEHHQVEISGKYPFFGTKRILETPSASTSEEKKKTVVEYFDLEIEKHAVEYNPSDYDEMYNALITKKFLTGYSKGSNTTPVYQGYKGYGGYEYPKTYTPPYYDRSELDDDEFDSAAYYRQKFLSKEEKKLEKTAVQGTLFDDAEMFDSEFIEEALKTPVLQYKFNELILEVLTGCPIISKWVKTYEIKNSLFEEIFESFKDSGYTAPVYEEFIHDNLVQRFEITDPEDYFPKNKTVEEYAPYILENIIIIKMIEAIGELEATDYSIAVINALKDFYSI